MIVWCVRFLAMAVNALMQYLVLGWVACSVRK